MIKLKDIRDYMMNSMSHYNPNNDGEYYDEDGHCGDGLWLEIQEFWSNFNTDADFKYLVSCEWNSDELDLEGGRSYLLDDKLADMCFDYMCNTLGWSLSDYQKIIHNTLDFSEEIEERYDNISTKRDEKICTETKTETNTPKVTKLKCITTEYNHYSNPDIIKVGEVYNIVDKDRTWEDRYKMIRIDIGGGERAEFIKKSFEPYIESKKEATKKNICNNINFEDEDFDYIPHVVKYHISRKTELDNCDSLEFLSKSLVDDNFVCYKIKSLGVKIPKGYKIVEPF